MFLTVSYLDNIFLDDNVQENIFLDDNSIFLDDNRLGSIFLDDSIFTDDNRLDSLFLDEPSKRRLNDDVESDIFLTETLYQFSIFLIGSAPDSLVLTDNSPDIVFFSGSSISQHIAD